MVSIRALERDSISGCERWKTHWLPNSRAPARKPSAQPDTRLLPHTAAPVRASASVAGSGILPRRTIRRRRSGWRARLRGRARRAIRSPATGAAFGACGFFPALHGSFRAASPSVRARLRAPSSLRSSRVRPVRPRRAPRDPLFHCVHDDLRRPAQRVDFRVRDKVFRRARHVSPALPQNSWAEIKGFSGRLPGLAPSCAMRPVEMPIPALPPGRSSNRRSPPGIQFPGDPCPRIHWFPTPAEWNFPLHCRRGSATGALERDTRIPVSGVALHRSSTNETHRLISLARTSARFPG